MILGLSLTRLFKQNFPVTVFFTSLPTVYVLPYVFGGKIINQAIAEVRLLSKQNGLWSQTDLGLNPSRAISRCVTLGKLSV